MKKGGTKHWVWKVTRGPRVAGRTRMRALKAVRRGCGNGGVGRKRPWWTGSTTRIGPPAPAPFVRFPSSSSSSSTTLPEVQPPSRAHQRPPCGRPRPVGPAPDSPPLHSGGGAGLQRRSAAFIARSRGAESSQGKRQAMIAGPRRPAPAKQVSVSAGAALERSSQPNPSAQLAAALAAPLLRWRQRSSPSR